MILDGLPEGNSAHPAIVVGAGPAGLVQALELRRHGVEVLVLAGGADGFDADFQEAADAEIVDPRRHAPMQMAVRRTLGGTSLLWGGRCVPFDAVDFAPRPHVAHSGWPISADDIRPWYERAALYLDAGPMRFSAPIPGVAHPAGCCLDRLERWSEARNLRQLHAARLAADPGLRIVLGAVATGLDVDPVTGRARGVTVALKTGERIDLWGRAIVLACGGLETTRLLLAARMERPRLFGGPEGALGRYYMGHLEGRIADIVFEPGAACDGFNFFVDGEGRYVRRRITVAEEAQQRLGLLNMAGWPDNRRWAIRSIAAR